MSVNKKLTLQEILDNTPETFLYNDEEVLVRCPTTQEKLDARKEATTIPGWDVMSSAEQNVEIARRTALKMLVDPKISTEDYLKANDNKISMLLDTINMWYAVKIKGLNDKRSTLMNNFLQQMKASNQ